MILHRKGTMYSIGIGNWEDYGLKKPVLYVQVGNVQYKVASFNNNEALELLETALKSLFDKGEHENKVEVEK